MDLMPSEANSWFAHGFLVCMPPYVRTEKYRQALSISSFKGTAPTFTTSPKPNYFSRMHLHTITLGINPSTTVF